MILNIDTYKAFDKSLKKNHFCIDDFTIMFYCAINKSTGFYLPPSIIIGKENE